MYMGMQVGTQIKKERRKEVNTIQESANRRSLPQFSIEKQNRCYEADKSIYYLKGSDCDF